jgi:hypothetical protein
MKRIRPRIEFPAYKVKYPWALWAASTTPIKLVRFKDFNITTFHFQISVYRWATMNEYFAQTHRDGDTLIILLSKDKHAKKIDLANSPTTTTAKLEKK